MKIKCIVVDDEPLARQGIADYVSKVGFFELCGSFASAIEANDFLTKEQIDLVFLDIEMPGMNGVSFVQSLVKTPIVIFITAYPGYALTGFEVNAVDYMVKPVSFERFMKGANKALEKYKGSNNAETPASIQGDFIFIRTENKFQKLMYADINYIEGLKDYVKIITAAGKHIALANLKTIGAALPERIFMRVHKSFIVNLEKVTSLDGTSLQVGDTTVPVGKEYKDKLFEVLVKRNLIQR